MKYRFVRGPFMLMETVYMLFKYVNGISFHDILYRLKAHLGGEVPENQGRVLRRVQQIMEQVCSGLDPREPQLQRFFRKDEKDPDICLAIAMVATLEDMGSANVRDAIKTICDRWHWTQEHGCWIRETTDSQLYITGQPGCPGDLFEQIERMDSSPEFKITLYGGLRKFDQTAQELLELIEPLAERLAAIYREESWLFESVEESWQEVFAKTPPEEFLNQFFDDDNFWDPTKELRISVSMMHADCIRFSDCRYPPIGQDYEWMYIGCGTPNCGLRRGGPTGGMDAVSATMKFLSDRKRLEILQRLSQEASYGAELAESLDMHSGNMSRTLSQLYSHGFLRQERQDARLYYRTDRDSFISFLRLVERTVLGD